MSQKFKISFAVCLALFILFNGLRLLTGPPARIGVSGWRTFGVPFAAKVENVEYTTAGAFVTTIKNEPWLWAANLGVWLLLSYRFSRWVDQRGAAWWRGDFR